MLKSSDGQAHPGHDRGPRSHQLRHRHLLQRGQGFGRTPPTPRTLCAATSSARSVRSRYPSGQAVDCRDPPGQLKAAARLSRTSSSTFAMSRGCSALARHLHGSPLVEQSDRAQHLPARVRRHGEDPGLPRMDNVIRDNQVHRASATPCSSTPTATTTLRDDCTKETGECPSWGNTFEGMAERMGPRARKAPIAPSSGRTTPGDVRCHAPRSASMPHKIACDMYMPAAAGLLPMAKTS